jgi:PAS domain S-box-containing protein
MSAANAPPPPEPRPVALLVDDDPRQTERVVAVLAASRSGGHPGFGVVAVAGLADAIARLENGGVEVVLLDLALPDAAGLAAVETLRARFPHVALVVRTDLDDEAIALAAIRAGAHDCVDKSEPATAALPRTLLVALERARADGAQRRRMESRLRASVDDAPHGIFRATPDGRFLDANPALARMLGHADPRELVAVRGADTLGDPALPERLAAAARQPLGPVECTWHRRDGGTVRVRLDLRPAGGADGAPEVEGFVVDVTPLHAVQDALRRAERLATVGQLVSGIAHELNNPLSAILLSAENLLHEGAGSGDGDSLRIIRDQAQRARAVVRDLRAVIFHPDVRRAPVWLASAAESVGARLEGQAAREGVALRRETRGVLLPVLADPAGIEQAIAHLVVNGIQAAPGGTVRVIADGDGADCTLVVEDDGPGIAPEHLGRVFEPFFSTRTAGPAGARGLGLPIALGIVEQCGGTLTAENRGAGERGARFTMRIPAYHAEAADGEARAAGIAQAALGPSPHTAVAAALVPALPPGTGGGASTVPPAPPASADPVRPPRVLVVDDELAIRTALRRFFARRQWEVDEAENGEIALAKLLADDGGGRYALVVSDLKMPGLTGIELHDRLLAVRPELLQRLIFSTGDTASHEVAEFVERTRCRVLEKPFELSVIAEVADGIVGRAG